MIPVDDIEIIDYTRGYADAFARLNFEWLEKYFFVEPIDREILTQPEATILHSGGVILFARKGDDIVGTVALKHHGDGDYELTKMAVTEQSQGVGIGRRLLGAVIRRFEDLGGGRLYLESHSSLSTALALYEAAGFVHCLPPVPSDYERADTYMVYRPE